MIISETSQAANDVSAFNTFLVNPCNLVGAMGKGIALWYKTKYPMMYEVYCVFCRDKKFSSGDLFVWKTHGTTVVNLPTKNHWKFDAKYEFIERGLKTLNTFALERDATIVMPRIGSGLGNLDWKENIRPLVDSFDMRTIIATGYMDVCAIEPSADDLYASYRLIKYAA